MSISACARRDISSHSSRRAGVTPGLSLNMTTCRITPCSLLQEARNLAVHDHIEQIWTPRAKGALQSGPEVFRPLHHLALDAEAPCYLNDLHPVHVEAGNVFAYPDGVPEALEDRVPAVVDDDEGDTDAIPRGGPESLDRVHARPVPDDARHRPLGDGELEPDGARHSEPQCSGDRQVIASGLVDSYVLVELCHAGDGLVEDGGPLRQGLGEGVHHELDGHRVGGLGDRRFLRSRRHGAVRLGQEPCEGKDRSPHVAHDAAPYSLPLLLLVVFVYLQVPLAVLYHSPRDVGVVEEDRRTEDEYYVVP